MHVIDFNRVAVVVILAAGLAGAPGAPRGTVPDEKPGRDLTRPQAGRVLDLIYQGKTQAAVTYLDTLSAVDRSEPFYLLVRSRLAREFLPVDDDEKERLKAASAPVHRDLDRVIEVCTRRLEDGGNGWDPTLRLYRGVAWMSKAHLHSFARSFWSAGRDAKKGKSDLGDYLEIHPDDPLALGTMGVFLYFADTIPTLFKYISKLLLMPGGDREKGLDYLHRAARTESVFQTDYQVVAASIDLLFEGRFEPALVETRALLERYPGYPRLAVPLALMQPFDPARVVSAAAAVDAALEGYESAGISGGETGGAERYPLALLAFLNAYAARFVAPPGVAEAELTRLTEPDSERPDWITGYAAFELGRLAASLGDTNDAREVFAFVRQNPSAAFLREDADRMADALDRYPPSVPEDLPVTEIYFGTPAERAALVADSVRFGGSPAGLFYRGETLLLAGRTEGALAVFAEVCDAPAAPWDEEFQMLAACRAAEITGAEGDYEGAADWMDRAGRYYHKEYLVDWILEARREYYKRLARGEETVTPSLLEPVRRAPAR